MPSLEGLFDAFETHDQHTGLPDSRGLGKGVRERREALGEQRLEAVCLECDAHVGGVLDKAVGHQPDLLISRPGRTATGRR